MSKLLKATVVNLTVIIFYFLIFLVLKYLKKSANKFKEKKKFNMMMKTK